MKMHGIFFIDSILDNKSSLQNTLTSTSNNAETSENLENGSNLNTSTSTSWKISDDIKSENDVISALDFHVLSRNEDIYEAAAKLLFLSVKWVRSIPSFLQVII